MSRRFARAGKAAALATLVLLAACAPPRAGIDVEGKLDVLGPTPDLVAAGLPGDWAVQGRAEPGQARVVERDGVPALRLAPGANGFILARRTDAQLLTAPYLSWSWNADHHGEGLHPVRLIVGFQGGSGGGNDGSFGGGALPAHDRSFAATWADSALRRGTLFRAQPDEAPRAPIYIVRGGRENANVWWLETIDLERIYRDLWPGDDPARAKIVFIGLAVVGGAETKALMHVSGIRLSR